MKLRTFDLGYRVALLIGRRTFVLCFPLPLSWGSIKYLWRP